MEAAPPAPASPDPTMMTVYLRLLAGFTSFMSKRCFSHFFSMGPDGAFESSFIGCLYFRIPAWTATGNETLPISTISAIAHAAASAHRRYRGWARPSVWHILH